MCYALLTGSPPFQAMTATETVTNIRTADPPPPRAVQPGIPPAFEGVVLRLLAKHPADRYHSAEDLVEELEQIGRNAGVIKV
jgi:serine/threonine-protein kinase